MNPDPEQLAYLSRRDAQQRIVREERQARLHKKAVERRRKAKRGGKR